MSCETVTYKKCKIIGKHFMLEGDTRRGVTIKINHISWIPPIWPNKESLGFLYSGDGFAVDKVDIRSLADALYEAAEELEL